MTVETQDATQQARRNQARHTAAGVPGRQHTTPLGTGELHQALEDARDLGRLHSFCRAHKCSIEKVSKDGKRLDMLLVLDLMRGRGYSVTAPVPHPKQLQKGHTAWLVHLTVPTGAQCQLVFFTPGGPR